MRESLASLAKIPGFLRDPKIAHSYFPGEPRKRRARIWLDNILWTIRKGDLNDYYFMFGLDRRHGGEPHNYLGRRESITLLQKYNNKAWSGLRGTDYRCLCKDKFVFGAYLTALSFPTPKNLAVYDGTCLRWVGLELSGELGSILDFEGLDVFCKDVLGAFGKGVFSLKVEGRKLTLDGSSCTIDEFRKRIPVPALLQKRLVQHPRVAEIYPHSINTFRLVTVRRGRVASPFRAIMRFGAHGSRVDNWAAGGIAVPVDLHEGRLAGRGLFGPGAGEDFAGSHPDTGLRFNGFEIPFFEEAIDLATRLHGFFYGLKIIGWDIALTPDGPVFIEGNHRWDAYGMQTLVGGLKGELCGILSSDGAPLEQEAKARHASGGAQERRSEGAKA